MNFEDYYIAILEQKVRKLLFIDSYLPGYQVQVLISQLEEQSTSHKYIFAKLEVINLKLNSLFVWSKTTDEVEENSTCWSLLLIYDVLRLTTPPATRSC